MRGANLHGIQKCLFENDRSFFFLELTYVKGNENIPWHSKQQQSTENTSSATRVQPNARQRRLYTWQAQVENTKALRTITNKHLFSMLF